MKCNAPLFLHFFLILALSLYCGLAATHATPRGPDKSPSQPGDETPSQPGIQIEIPYITDIKHDDANWLPVAGETITVSFNLVSLAGSATADVTVTLPEVSSFKGICGNVKGDNPSDNDFRLLSSSNSGWEESGTDTLTVEVAANDSSKPITTPYTIVVDCHDYAAFGVLKVETTRDGNSISEASLRLPKDNNENEIADKWENEKGFYTADKTEAAKTARKDDDLGPNTRNDLKFAPIGDGISVFDEYRGMRLKDGQHQRLNPSTQEIFVYWDDDNATYINNGVGMATKLPGIVPYLIDNEDRAEPGLDILRFQHEHDAWGLWVSRCRFSGAHKNACTQDLTVPWRHGGQLLSLGEERLCRVGVKFDDE